MTLLYSSRVEKASELGLEAHAYIMFMRALRGPR